MHSYSVIAHDNDIYITGGHSSNQCTVDIVSGLILNFSFSNFFSIFFRVFVKVVFFSLSIAIPKMDSTDVNESGP